MNTEQLFWFTAHIGLRRNKEHQSGVREVLGQGLVAAAASVVSRSAKSFSAGHHCSSLVMWALQSVSPGTWELLS